MKAIKKAIRVDGPGMIPCSRPEFFDQVKATLAQKEVAWETAPALPEEPEAGVVYLVHAGPVAGSDARSFKSEFGELSSAVAARVILDDCSLTGDWEIAGALGLVASISFIPQELVARLDVFERLYPDATPTVMTYASGKKIETHSSVPVEPGEELDLHAELVKVIEALDAELAGGSA